MEMSSRGAYRNGSVAEPRTTGRRHEIARSCARVPSAKATPPQRADSLHERSSPPLSPPFQLVRIAPVGVRQLPINPVGPLEHKHRLDIHHSRRWPHNLPPARRLDRHNPPLHNRRQLQRRLTNKPRQRQLTTGSRTRNLGTLSVRQTNRHTIPSARKPASTSSARSHDRLSSARSAAQSPHVILEQLAAQLGERLVGLLEHRLPTLQPARSPAWSSSGSALGSNGEACCGPMSS
jgi:hypothetical protein